MNRCDSCRNISTCPACSRSVADFHHVGARGTSSHVRIPIIDYKLTYDTQPSGVWHYARPCGHRIYPTATSSIVKYNGGPLWQDGYTWQNVYWGTYYAKPAASQWIKRLELATTHLESDNSYSGGLRQYNVGIGKVIGPVTVQQDPPSQISNDQIKKTLTDWISAGTVIDLTTKGAHNIFLHLEQVLLSPAIFPVARFATITTQSMVQTDPSSQSNPILALKVVTSALTIHLILSHRACQRRWLS